MDLAALGLRSNTESAQHNSDKNTMLTHVLKHSSDFALPSLHKLGLFAAYSDADFGTDNIPIATYGLALTRSIVNKPLSGLREMFDCSLSYRVSSVFEEVAKRSETVIISRFLSYLFAQEFCNLFQIGTDEAAFSELDHQLEKVETGFIYAQLPDLQEFDEKDQVNNFMNELSVVDNYLGKLMNNLHDDDLLMVVSSRVGDAQSRDGFSTYKILPAMLYNNQALNHHFQEEPYVCEVGSTVLAALGLQDSVISPKHSLLPFMK
ncbi:hypothetical protein IV52_GL000111 [Fructilactobacillus lindneri DSM 20690 = JCM 11027]|uniref:Phosphopentomutase n=1 Tax=Fructilactobacillus lindneri DSM 20690 = JCM 11027 TaxID=1122148 RepID=A0A0R2JZY2_9LACO|nr:hypothetical protein IV52_GL000111 [Fructilactobacillus lindneri DSM 20690 = JCM 11027]